MQTLGLAMYLVLVCTWTVFGFSMLLGPSLLGLLLLVMSFAVIIEFQHVLERGEANINAR